MSLDTTPTVFTACRIFQDGRRDMIRCATAASEHGDHWHVWHAIAPVVVIQAVFDLAQTYPAARPEWADVFTVPKAKAATIADLEQHVGRWVAGLHAGAGRDARN